MTINLIEAKKALEKCLGQELEKEYVRLLRKWLSFKSPITKDEFDTNVRKLLTNPEQLRTHYYFMQAVLGNLTKGKLKSLKSNTDNNGFEYAEYLDYIQLSSPSSLPPSDVEYRSAALELFVPDSGFVNSRIAVSAWENGMEGADDGVTEVIVYACQMFIKNILTAMLSRKKGYKVRDGKFQYGFNQSIPDPFIRNFANVVDDTQESKVEVDNEDDSFVPKYKQSLERMEQQVAFAHSCSKKRKFDPTLTVKLLYETLKENPRLLGLHSIQSINLLKLGLQLDE